jgi:hypothetical protein
MERKTSRFPDESLCSSYNAAPKPRRTGVCVVVIRDVSHVVIDVPLFATEFGVSNLSQEFMELFLNFI